jgi:small subunit ribosomal protein S6
MSDGMKTYECMFLVDAGNPDFHAAGEPARTVLDRCGAEVLAIKPWDERRLAYEIRGRRRGLYILAYFKASPDRIADLERDCQLDERILRLLVLRRDNLTEQQVSAETPATTSAKRAAVRRAEDKAGLPSEDTEEGAEEEVEEKAEEQVEEEVEDKAEKEVEEESPGEEETPPEPVEPAEPAEAAAEAQDGAEALPAADDEPAEPAPSEQAVETDESQEKPEAS